MVALVDRKDHVVAAALPGLLLNQSKEEIEHTMGVPFFGHALVSAAEILQRGEFTQFQPALSKPSTDLEVQPAFRLLAQVSEA